MDLIYRDAIMRSLCYLEGLPRPPRSVKESWSLPTAPRCPECNAIALPVALNTGDGWALGWDCSNTCGPDAFAWDDGDEGLGEPPGWPFYSDYADSDDFSNAGFQIE